MTGRYVTDWAGPEARVRRFEFRLGRPNYPGDVMTLSERVRDRAAMDRALLTIDVAGDNGLGRHVTTSFDLELPA